MALGAVTTLLDYIVYSALIFFNIHYVIAIVVGYGVGLWFNFEAGRRFIFTAGVKVKSAHTELMAVVLIAIGGVLINIAIVKLLSYSIWTIDPMLSRILGIGTAFFWNYFMRKRYVYH